MIYLWGTGYAHRVELRFRTDLRRRIADGTASPSEISTFEATSAGRQSAMDAATADAVEALVASRERQLLLTGMFASLYQVAQGVRAKGFSGIDFRDDTALLVAGGLKGAALPADYREFIFDTFNISDERVYHFYTMQELNTPFPKCRAGRYHVPPWVLLLPLDEPGENLVDTSVGPVQARGAFFDLSLDGRVAVVTGSEKSPPGGDTAPTMLTEPIRSGEPSARVLPARS